MAGKRKKRTAATATSQPPPQSLLLGLPPELRNRIYRCLLLEQETILVSGTNGNATQPGLLRTCQQLRNEASNIFYHENTFFIDVVNLRMVFPGHHWINVKVPLAKGTLKLTGTSNWEHLKEWLKMARQCNSIRPYASVGHANQFRVVSKAFDIISDMEGSKWQGVEKVLESFREATGIAGMNWA